MEGYCEECGRPAQAVHHMVFGKNRKNSEKYKKYCTCKLCNECHFILHNRDEKMAKKYRRKAQERFEAEYGHDKWMEVFGRNYIQGEDEK